MLLMTLGSKAEGRGKAESMYWENLPLWCRGSPSRLLRLPLPTVDIGVCQLVARHLNRLCQLEKSHLLVDRCTLVPGPPAGSHMAFRRKSFQKGTREYPKGYCHHRRGPSGKDAGWTVVLWRCNLEVSSHLSFRGRLHWICLGRMKTIL